jgi:hypothetical protein
MAAAIVLFGIVQSFSDNDEVLIIIVASCMYAALVWLVGRAARYFLAGE